MKKGKKEPLALLPIRFYQRYLSPLKPFPTCRVVPCCSTYAATAIRGVDPVPVRFTLRPFAGLEEEQPPKD